VQPVGWWLGWHVRQGKRELNFSEFTAYSAKRAVRKLRHVAEEVSGHEMPLKSYLLMHSEARLSAADRKLLADWADGLADELGSH
jgi:hypothetical protein